MIAGSGGGSPQNQVEAADTARSKGVKRIGPYMVPRTMTSTTSACLATPFEIKGVNYSIASACATSAHCIGERAEQIALGKQDIMFAGGGEELHWSLSCLFDAMGALSTQYNDTPGQGLARLRRRSRRLRHRRRRRHGGAGGATSTRAARGAKIYAELVGYGATSDGYDMVAPSRRGRGALHAHGARGRAAPRSTTSTPTAPRRRSATSRSSSAVREVFVGDAVPPIRSTKSLSGHSLGAAGVHEAIYCLLMMEDGFIAGSANIDELDPAVGDLPIVSETRDARLNTVMSNSFGFGGTNATLVLRRV